MTRFALASLALTLALARTNPASAQPKSGFADNPTQEQLAFFEKKVRPVLVDNCYKCHSAEAQKAGKLKGDLLLDTRAGVLKGGENGPAVVPGKPDESRLIKAVRYVDDDLKMPPKGKGERLS